MIWRFQMILNNFNDFNALNNLIDLNDLTTNKFRGETFQAAQLTHERFLTLDHSWEYLFLISAHLNFHRVNKIWAHFSTYKIYFESLIFAQFDHFVKFQLSRYQKNISKEWCRIKKLSYVSCAAWNAFPVNLSFSLSAISLFYLIFFHNDLRTKPNQFSIKLIF